MATSRTRSRSFSSGQLTDLSWLLSRKQYTAFNAGKAYPQCLFKVYEGPAYSYPPTRADIGILKRTMTDQIGSPDRGSTNRYFPDKMPFRPLVITGPSDTDGTRATDGFPAASPAHTFRDYLLEPKGDAGLRNREYLQQQLVDRLPGAYGDRGRILGDTVNLVVELLPRDTRDQVLGLNVFSTPEEAVAHGQALASAVTPNLDRGEWCLSDDMSCIVRVPNSGGPNNWGAWNVKPAERVKTLTSGEQAALLDARRDAYESMCHQSGGTQLNCLRSVLELKDVPDTVKSVRDFLLTYSKVQSLASSTYLTSSADRARLAELTLGQVAAIHLWYQFGIRPTVSEVDAWMRQLGSRKLATLTRDERDGLLRTGDTVRCAYSLDKRVSGARIENSCVYDVQYIDTTVYASSYRFSTNAMAIYQPDAVKLDLPEGNEWLHSGLLFSRALKPEWTMMPDWFPELMRSLNMGDVEEPLVRLSKDELALYFNPPLKSLWNVTSLSWLSDWAWNASGVLSRIERHFSRVVCAFEEMWALDKWTWTPRRWTCIPTIEVTSLADASGPLGCNVTAGSFKYPPFSLYGRRYYPVLSFPEAARSAQPQRVKYTVRYTYLLQTPPTSVWENVSRCRIPLPPVRLPSFFEGTLDAWRIGILSALSIVRLSAMSKALREAKWSVAKVLGMWGKESAPVINPARLALCVTAVLAAKEFTHE